MHPPDLPRVTARPALAAAGGFAVLLLLVQAHVGWLTSLNGAVADGLHGWARTHRRAVDLLLVVQAVLSPDVFRVAALLAAARLWRRRRRAALWAVGATAAGLVLDVALKALVHRPRPAWPDPVATSAGYSFPSGHALGSFLGAGVLLVLLRPVLGPAARRVAYVLAAVLVLLVGFDRVALGVHDVSDVLAGWLTAAAVLAGSLQAAGTGGEPEAVPAGRTRQAARGRTGREP